VIVGFTAGTSPARAASIIGSVADAPTETLRGGAHVVHVATARAAATIAALRAHSGVRYAEPNNTARATLVPNDPSFSKLWGMTRIGAPTAWEGSTGDGSAVAAVLDTGVDAAHPDLAANMWHNPGGLWGCAAGTTGYDVINTDCDPYDDHHHGTHVAGTIGAVGNNSIGVVGVNWHVQLMAVKVLDFSGSGSDANVADGIDKVIDAKNAGVNVRVISMSLGGEGPSTTIQDAVGRADAAGIVVVAAAGNSSDNVDAQPFVPCIYADLCVAATTSTDKRAAFSNYGPSTVDIAAPGVNTLSTVPGGGYETLSGTSMATPDVSGAIALLAQSGVCRTWTASQLTSLVLNSSDTVAGLTIAGNRRLNVGRAMKTCTGPTTTVLTSGRYVRGLSAGAGSDDFYKLTVPSGRTKVVFGIGGGSGNADLYVRFGAPPTLAIHDCAHTRLSNAESCTILNPAAGDYYVLIHATAAYKNVSLHGTYMPR
jgi:subtilisin family serine protease